jgi:hypothetical protein
MSSARGARALYLQLQTLLAGHSTKDALQALCDSLSSVAGFAVDDLATAEQLIDELAPDIKKTIRENWDYLSEVRAAAGAGVVGHG